MQILYIAPVCRNDLAFRYKTRSDIADVYMPSRQLCAYDRPYKVLTQFFGGLEPRVWGLGSRVQGPGSRVQGPGSR
eukprot:3215574-Rhodomonas_salina.1